MKTIKIGAWYKSLRNEHCLVKVLGLEKELDGEDITVSFYDIEKDEYFTVLERFFKDDYTNKLTIDDIKITKELNKKIQKDLNVIKKSAKMVIDSNIEIKFKEFFKIRKELEREISSLSLKTENQMAELKKKDLLNDSISNYLDEQFDDLDVMLDFLYGNINIDSPRLKILGIKKRAKAAIISCNQVDD